MDAISSAYNLPAAYGYAVRLRQERATGAAVVEAAPRTNGPASEKSDSQRGFQPTESQASEFTTYSPPATKYGTDLSLDTASSNLSPLNSKQDPQVQAEVARLKSTEEKVKTHEAAHKSAGGTMTGPVSYTYTRGPDGRNYVTGGEVPISASPGKTPQETISRMQQVIQAALAPADPSPQDRAVAAQAAAQQQQARQDADETSPSQSKLTSDSSQKNEAAAAVAAPNTQPDKSSGAPTGFQPVSYYA